MTNDKMPDVVTEVKGPWSNSFDKCEKYIRFDLHEAEIKRVLKDETKYARENVEMIALLKQARMLIIEIYAHATMHSENDDIVFRKFWMPHAATTITAIDAALGDIK
jgi:hypothetical protein